MQKVNIDLRNYLDVLVTTVISTQNSYNRFISDGNRNEDFVKFQKLLDYQNELIGKISNSYCKLPIEPKGKINILVENEYSGTNHCRITKFIEYNDKRFKLVFDLRNGGRDIIGMVMDSHGVFQQILSKLDLGDTYKLTSSYVSDYDEQLRDGKNAIKLLENLIKILYQ